LKLRLPHFADFLAERAVGETAVGARMSGRATAQSKQKKNRNQLVFHRLYSIKKGNPARPDTIRLSLPVGGALRHKFTPATKQRAST
jgi:hypothetical protein